MKWWHWALIGGGVLFLVTRKKTLDPVITGGVISPKVTSGLSSRAFHAECCKKGVLVAGNRSIEGPGLCNCQGEDDVYYFSYKFNDGGQWGQGPVEGHTAAHFAQIEKLINQELS